MKLCSEMMLNQGLVLLLAFCLVDRTVEMIGVKAQLPLHKSVFRNVIENCLHGISMTVSKVDKSYANQHSIWVGQISKQTA